MPTLTSTSAVAPPPDACDGRLAVEFFEPPLTPALWRAWEEATHSYGCTQEFAEFFEGGARASLALLRAGPTSPVAAAFLFELEGDAAVRVLGRFYAPAPEHLAVFVEAVLARHPRVERIRTGVIDALGAPSEIRRPVLAAWEGTEMRIALPRSMEEHERSLDRDFTKRMRGSARRLTRECPSARIMTLEGGAIPRSWVADIVRLNRERLASKNQRSVLNERYEEGIFQVARAHGSVTALLDGDRICGGEIDIRCGTESFGWVIAFDEAYGRFRPGYLCALASIRHAITRGGGTLHLLHGHSSYKRDLGGRQAPIATYVVLRSWVAARPADGARVLLRHAARLAGKAIDLADPIAARALGRREPIKSFAHQVLHRVRAFVRS